MSMTEKPTLTLLEVLEEEDRCKCEWPDEGEDPQESEWHYDPLVDDPYCRPCDYCGQEEGEHSIAQYLYCVRELERVDS